ncbi:sigma non-opioid intracellular receptor 1-like [Lingula anatina]|uniref:Sigma non-opioid intracellular receptor 1 n=1 Tax=Lingula anatina TaxID=7574 RepID=A0A1S3HGR0_LINAN|nr:sigma non-opioid intracellular receptor 1 [Lingula anatina]XP_013385563.1 sigma non-opioid intracellular receptor 1-like [Lingula anatina]|eukprot:XP_013385255.1 sigma non-opioid intracellular receptor 1 [Lingula anatina]
MVVCMLRCIISLVKISLLLGVLVYGIHFWLSNKDYVFDAGKIAKISEKYAGYEAEAAFRDILKELEDLYPGHILPSRDHQWIFVNAGGWMGSMMVVHASLTEYVLFFGTAIDTAGHSGRYWANISDTLITGQYLQWKEGEMKSTVYGPGDTIYHGMGEVTSLNFKADTWMVEYGRGFIPSTLPFALADTVFGTTDFVTAFYTVRVYAKALWMEGSLFVGEFRDYLKGNL